MRISKHVRDVEAMIRDAGIDDITYVESGGKHARFDVTFKGVNGKFIVSRGTPPKGRWKPAFRTEVNRFLREVERVISEQDTQRSTRFDRGRVELV